MNDYNNWLEERTVLLGVSGSYAYNTYTDQSDKDYIGVCVPPESYFLGLDTFKEYNNSNGGNFKNTKDDVDIKIMHVLKFVQLAMSGAPQSLELLFLPEKHLLKVSDYGRELLNNKHLFLSKEIKNKFGGFARSQKSRFVKSEGENTKDLMHSVRLLEMATECFESGNLNVHRENREELLAIRNGKYSFKESLQLLDELDQRMNEAYFSSELPEHPDREKINALLMTLNLEAINSGLK